MSSMEKRGLMQSVNPVLPGEGFAPEQLSPPHQAIVAFFARVTVPPPETERVSLEAAIGRVLAAPIVADDDYPAAPRSLMDGYALSAEATPGAFEIVGDVQMGLAPDRRVSGRTAVRIPTGGVLPPGADAVVPVEDVQTIGDVASVSNTVAVGENVVERGADMHRAETILAPHRRIGAPEIGVLATLGITHVPVFRRPRIAIFSSGDELIDPADTPKLGQVRDSNRYVVAASLRAMGAAPHHYPALRDEAPEFESALSRALQECDGVVVTGGSSVGERDRLPRAVAAIAEPGIVVHGLRIKPGKPTLFAASGNKPIIGLPGNPTSALLVLEAVAVPIVAALCGARVVAASVQARLAEAASSRAGWTWYIPVRLRDDGDVPFAHPLALRSFSVSLTARADGYIVMDERNQTWEPGTLVTVVRFLHTCGA
jgi:molybdenum cofactor synthesis domain-containing protein